MIGKSQVQITAAQMAAGLPTSDYLGDGGIGLESQNINPLINQGVIYATGAQSSSGVLAHLIASCEDYNNPSTENRYMVDSSSNIYYLNNAGIVTKSLAGVAGYTIGITDMVAFAYTPHLGSVTPAAFISHNSDVSILSGANGSSFSESYWSGVAGSALVAGVPHPLLVYQNLLWVGDGMNLHNMTTGSTISLDVLTLDQNETIFSLGIDPATGLMMIGVRTTVTGASSSTPARSFIYLFDGYSARARRKIPISGAPLSFTTVGGQVFCGIDNSIGLWNGNGVTFMRRLSTLSSLAYKQRVCAVNNLLLVCDNTNVLCYGDIQNLKKVWFPMYSGSSAIDVVFQESVGSIGLSYDGSTVEFINLFSTSTGTGALYTPVISFPRPTDIRMIRVFTTGITTTTGIGSIGIIDENQKTYAPTVNEFVVPSTGSPQYKFDFYFGDPKLQSLQVFVNIATQSFGIIKIIVYYDTTE